MSTTKENYLCLRAFPFHSLSKFQLNIEFEKTKVKYKHLKENNNFQLHFDNKLTKDQLQTYNCKYYDEEAFNQKAANKPCQLSLIHCNLQSSFKNFALLKANLMNLNHQFSMIAISETGISKHDILSTIFDNYEFHSKIPKSNKKGGVGIYFKNGCIYSRRHDLDFVSDLPIEDM